VNSTHAASVFKAFPALRRSYRRGDRAKALQEAGRRADELDAPPHVHPEGTPHVPLEAATTTFRYLQQRMYRAKAAAARAEAKHAADVWSFAQSVNLGHVDPVFPIDPAAIAEQERDAMASARWYEGRAGAQIPRFDTIRACGSRVLHVGCRPCGQELCAPIPCRCGVVRVCEACADAIALKREKRIAAARAAAILKADDRGLFHAGRAGLGAWSEKMLTLTVPHIELEAVEAGSEVAGETTGYGLHTTIAARIAALRLAWPRFMRSLRRFITKHEGKTNAKAFRYFRFLEWTRGHDGQGHPHFHVYLLSPFLDQRMIAGMWARALDAVGVGPSIPLSCGRCASGEGCPLAELDAKGAPKPSPHVIVDIRRLYGYQPQQLRELIKRGERTAIECRLGPLQCADQVTQYANGWTMADAFDELGDAQMVDAKRDVYIALEGRRMAQGARGFLLPLPSPSCSWCGCACFAAHVVDPCKSNRPDAPQVDRVQFPNEERPPPS